MKILSRTPAGAFMSRGDAIRSWLPVMLGWAYYSPLETALEAMQRFCISEFRDQYRMAHGASGWVDSDSITTNGYYEAQRHKQAQLWLQKRDILARALAEIKAVGNG